MPELKSTVTSKETEIKKTDVEQEVDTEEVEETEAEEVEELDPAEVAKQKAEEAEKKKRQLKRKMELKSKKSDSTSTDKKSKQEIDEEEIERRVEARVEKKMKESLIDSLEGDTIDFLDNNFGEDWGDMDSKTLAKIVKAFNIKKETVPAKKKVYGTPEAKGSKAKETKIVKDEDLQAEVLKIMGIK